MSRLRKNCTIVKLISWIHLTELDDLSIRVFENLSAGISDVPRNAQMEEKSADCQQKKIWNN